jgi:hypothetical protein
LIYLFLFFFFFFLVAKIPYSQLPLQLLVKRDMRDPNESAGLPVNIANGSINIDMAKMMAVGGLQVPGGGLADAAAGITGTGGVQNGGWGLWNMVKDAAAAVTPSGVPPAGGFGDMNGGGMMTNGGGAATNALGYSPDLKLPDGKRLAYRQV